MFKTFSIAVHDQYNKMAEQVLYTTDILDIFESYLNAFPEGTNPMYRVRTEHDCNCCKNFIRRLGHLVTLDESGNRQTVWDNYHELPAPYDVVGKAMRDLVMQAPLVSVFYTKETIFGSNPTPDNHDAKLWNHFVGTVHTRHRSNKPGEVCSTFNTGAQVFERGLTELKPEAFDTVLALIEAKDLYRGEEHLRPIQEFQKIQQAYLKATDKKAFVLVNASKPVARFRNTAIGTLLTDLSDDVPVDQAVRIFESKVAPLNYKRTSAPISPKMIDDAVAKLSELGLEGAIHRRHAKISDVSINDVIWVDNASKILMKDSISDLLMPSAFVPAANIKSATDITIANFMEKEIGNFESMSVLVRNDQVNNLMSITGGDGPERLFKWDNNFAWSYNGEVTDSIKERVKKAGGRVVGAKLRVSLSWFNIDDLDIHCTDPTNQHIFYGNKLDILDVDMNAGSGTNNTPVENLSWMGKLKDGSYMITVDQYSQRTKENPGFIIEVEYEGKLTQYRYNHEVRVQITCLQMIVEDGRLTKIISAPSMSADAAPKDVWGIKTETLVPVQTVMLSPNFWGDNASGNKHWFFILKDCNNPDPVRGIYNEFLRSDLEAHRKVFELLGAKTKCQPTTDQLSGIGFSSTVTNELIVVGKTGSRSKAFNVKF